MTINLPQQHGAARSAGIEEFATCRIATITHHPHHLRIHAHNPFNGVMHIDLEEHELEKLYDQMTRHLKQGGIL